MIEIKSGKSFWRLVGIATIVFSVHSSSHRAAAQALAGSPTVAPEVGAPTLPTPTPIDPEAACARFVAAEVSAKPLADSELPPDLQQDLRDRLDVLAQCRAYVANSDDPCMALPTAERQNRCKADVADARQRYRLRSDQPEKAVRTELATGLYQLCISDMPEDQCRALERAVRDGDAKGCMAIPAAEGQRTCKALAKLDAKLCGSKKSDCVGTVEGLKKALKDGVAGLRFPNPESKLLTEIALGKTTLGCDAVADVIREDCVAIVRKRIEEPSSRNGRQGTAEKDKPVSADTPGKAEKDKK